MPTTAQQASAKDHSSGRARARRRPASIRNGASRSRPIAGKRSKKKTTRVSRTASSRSPSPSRFGRVLQRLPGRSAAEHRDEVLALVVDRAADPGLAVGVDDRLDRAAVVDLRHPGQRPLQQAVAGRLAVLLVGRPGRHHEDPDQGRHADPAPARQLSAQGDERGRAGSPRRRSSRGPSSPARAGRRSASPPNGCGAAPPTAG